MKQELRERVYQKFGGHCAYCGRIIPYSDMQVDHMKPHRGSIPKARSDKFENLMPSCHRCNHYKRAWRLEDFRRLIKGLSEKIQRTYLAKVAVDYGIIQFKPFDGVFYFEKYNKSIESIATRCSCEPGQGGPCSFCMEVKYNL